MSGIELTPCDLLKSFSNLDNFNIVGSDLGVSEGQGPPAGCEKGNDPREVCTGTLRSSGELSSGNSSTGRGGSGTG